MAQFSLCKKLNLLNSLCFPCLEKLTAKFPVFPVPWPPCHTRVLQRIPDYSGISVTFATLVYYYPAIPSAIQMLENCIHPTCKVGPQSHMFHRKSECIRVMHTHNRNLESATYAYGIRIYSDETLVIQRTFMISSFLLTCLTAWYTFSSWESISVNVLICARFTLSL